MQISDIKPGAKWSRHSFGTVTSAPRCRDDYVGIENEDGRQWNIGEEIFIDEFVVADYFNETKKVSRTVVVEQVLTHPYTAMAVCFRKKPDTKETAQEILKYAAGGKPTVAGIRKIIDNAGEKRVMIGRHHGQMNEHGRLMFYDMEANIVKQIDPRTVLWAVVKGTKYVVK